MLLKMTHLLPLELLLNSLIDKYLSTSYCISFFTHEPITFHSPVGFIYTILDEENLVEQILNVSEMGCSDYVVHMKEPHKFVAAFEIVIHKGNIRRSDRKIIILPHDDSSNDANLPTKVFSTKGSGFVANMLMATYYKRDIDCEVFDLITHKFVGPDEHIHEPLYLDRWNSCSNSFEKQVNLFPYDMTNLYGKTLRVAGFTYKPYVLLDVDTSLDPLGRDGIEVRIVDELCRWLNCTVEIVPEDIDQWGEIYENETGGIGVIGSVVEDRADLGITALYSWYEEWRVMDFSAAIVRTGITCVAPAPRLLSSWEMPLMPFTWYSWLAVVFTFFYASLGLLIAEGFPEDSHPFLTVFGMMIAQSQYESSVSWKIRSVTGWLLIVGLILGCAYGAGLATTFTVPRYEPSIDTVQDIVDRDMKWGATHDAWIFSLTLSTEPLVKQLVSQFRTGTFEELKRKSFTRSMAFSVEKLPAGNFAIGEYLTKDAVLDMMLMLEDFYYEQCVVMMRKSSPYTEKVNTLVGRLHQSGLMLAWETQVALKHLDYKVQQEVRLSRYKNEGGVTRRLGMTDVVGIFIMYVSGVVLAFAVFFGEIFANRRRVKKESIHIVQEDSIET
ncbi:glutamate receptor ionotropic, delta-1-like [Anticarsia gemmatalis]|uniref:glutamate receptor ionotropic, delta-1-like n=1 Tax=Anticarsia gemmatalis TaxID=129554 RepID=UPI003F775CF6